MGDRLPGRNTFCIAGRRHHAEALGDEHRRILARVFHDIVGGRPEFFVGQGLDRHALLYRTSPSGFNGKPAAHRGEVCAAGYTQLTWQNRSRKRPMPVWEKR